MGTINYKDSGVDIHKADQFVEKISRMVSSTYNSKTVSTIGGFCSVYDQGDRYLCASTDGVGTKLKIAQQLNIHNTIGIDLVAMCVNDLICVGATPIFFLDYMAFGNLDIKISSEIIEGIVVGCKQANMPLMGGETAEMPGLYRQDEYDLAGFSVGEVSKSDIIDGSKINESDKLIGIYSSGFHSNGYSLIRKLVDSSDKKLLKDLLTPTKIYVKPILEVLKSFPGKVKGISHITGSGFKNIPRMNSNFGYEINSLPNIDEIPNCMAIVCEKSGLPKVELYKTFNMGIGMVLAVENQNSLEIVNKLDSFGEKAKVIGNINNIKGKVTFTNFEKKFDI